MQIVIAETATPSFFMQRVPQKEKRRPKWGGDEVVAGEINL